MISALISKVCGNRPGQLWAVWVRGSLAASALLFGSAFAQSALPVSQNSAPVQSMPVPTEGPPQTTAAQPAADGSASPAPHSKSAMKIAKIKKVKAKKEKKPKLTPVTIADGVLTVDGFAGKAALNYEIADMQYLYIWAPGIGTAVISNRAFGQAKEQAGAFDGPSLTVAADGHQFQLTSSHRLLGKKPASAWVLLDTSYAYPSKYPAVGYGSMSSAPFVWPGSRQASAAKDRSVTAPPLPSSLLPVQLPATCPATSSQPAGCISSKSAAPALVKPATASMPSAKLQ